jgi:3-dehydroquinate dehydratase-1
MSAPRTVKATSRPRSVGVIFSPHDLQRALHLRKPPDFYELRLDGLVAIAGKLPGAIPRLRRPLIITARSPDEGGANNLSLPRRRDLLLRFLPYAALIDVELANAALLSSVLKRARTKKVQVILSVHDFNSMPELNTLRAFARRAHSLGADLFKIAARTDTREELANLCEFVESKSSPVPISAMGVGKLGRVSRAILARAGSVLNYAHLGRPTSEGQWSLAQLRSALRRE